MKQGKFKGDLAHFLMLQRQSRKHPAEFSWKFRSNIDRRDPLVKLQLTGFESRKLKVGWPSTGKMTVVHVSILEFSDRKEK
jgi:hypothetical protein